MDRRLIEEKLEALRRCVARIEAKRPQAAGVLASDSDLQDILALNLTRAVQLCVDVAAHLIAESEATAPATMGEAFDRLVTLQVLDPELATRMKRAVGFRNIAVHSYLAIDWQIVHEIAHKHVDDFRAFAAAVAKKL
ncbi:MAG: DUF86 domain-containing protein [Planctomycetes bacterium]|nr:DUF86 domain-containing protein [Planctomycetota bacterium]